MVDEGDFTAMVDDLGERGVRRLTVEGGTTIHIQFLTVGLADESTSPSRRSSLATRTRHGLCCPAASRMATPGVCNSRTCGR
jgi:hypothetical protein